MPPRRRPRPRPRCRRCATTRPPRPPRLQRLRVAHDALTAEAERVAQAQQEAETRLQQTEQRSCPRARPQGRRRGGDRRARRPARPARAGAGGRGRSRRRRRPRRATPRKPRPHAAETEHDRLTRQIADDEALRDSVGREIAELQERLRRLAARREEIAGQQRQIESELAGLPALPRSRPRSTPPARAFDEARQQGQQAIDAAREAERYESDAARQAVAKAEAERIDMERARAAERAAAEASHAAAAESLQKVNARLTKLRAEEAGVAAALKSAADSLWPPLLDALTVEPGFEKALGAAFGDELEASSDRGAPVHWLPLGPIADAPALPDGATPLGDHVKTLPELARRLAFIGVVADEATGAALQAGLKPGQQLVTRDGAVWRWDGYTMRAGAPSTAAVRLSQRNRLAEIRQQIDAVAAEHATAQARVEAEAGCAGRGPRCREDLASSRRARTSARWPRRRGARSEDAGEATRAAERAAQSAIAAAERAAAEARDRHTEVARRTDQLRTRLGRHRAGGGRDRGRHRRRRDAPHLPPGAPVVDLRHPGRPRGGRRAARAHRRAAGGAGRGRRHLRSPGPRGRDAGRAARPDRAGPCRLEQAPGRCRGPDRRARCAARTDRRRRSPSSPPSRPRSRPSAWRWARRSPRPSTTASRRPIGWPSARRGWARPTRR